MKKYYKGLSRNSQKYIASPRDWLFAKTFVGEQLIPSFDCKAKLLLLKLIQIFARVVLVMNKLEIEETKTT